MGDFGVSTSNRFASLDNESRKISRPKPAPGANTPASKAAIKTNASKASALKNAAPAAAAPAAAAARQSNNKAAPAAGRVRHGDQRGAADKPKGKRVFDKYSHSGKGQVPKDGKKAGGGRFNWGGKEEKQLEALADTAAADQTVATDDQAATTPSAETSNAPAQAEEPEEPAQRTYAEFKAAEEAKRAAIKAKVHLRQAGEGEDSAAWASFKPLEKADDAVSFGAAPVKSVKKNGKVAKAAGPKEVAISADKLFKIQSTDDSKPPRGGPRDARRGRGPKPEGAARPARQQQARGANRGGPKGRAQNIALNDTKAFPSLK